MEALGIRYVGSGRKRLLTLTFLDTAGATTTEIHALDQSQGEALQIKGAADWSRTVLKAHPNVEAVIIFVADHSPRSGLKAGTISRIRLEGAIAAACADTVTNVRFENGVSLGRILGGSKDDALQAGIETGVGRDHGESASAALAAMHLLTGD